jgi:hypothetical protein
MTVGSAAVMYCACWFHHGEYSLNLAYSPGSSLKNFKIQKRNGCHRAGGHVQQCWAYGLSQPLLLGQALAHASLFFQNARLIYTVGVFHCVRQFFLRSVGWIV